MAKVYQSATDLIGNTPLLEVTKLEKSKGLEAKVLIKLEYFNTSGSVKDRAAYYMVKDAEEKGLLKEGSVIIEPTSGNTGIGLASIAAAKGYRIILTMPETMSVERRNILKAYGEKMVLKEKSSVHSPPLICAALCSVTVHISRNPKQNGETGRHFVPVLRFTNHFILYRTP